MRTLNEMLAAITFFTRIPAWKLKELPGESYKHMIYFWPLTGWLTAGMTAGSWLLFMQVFPPLVAIVLALAVRVLFTGGFHEDGLGDFFDGFGGGRSKEDVLRIMKDSHAGSYSVLGLLLYYLLLVSTLYSMDGNMVAFAILCADPFSKFITSVMMNLLPYARTESESKSKTTYANMKWWQFIIAFACGIAPMLLFINSITIFAAAVSIVVMLIILMLSKKKIQGYTGDVCGATALLSELGFYLGMLAILHFSN